MMIAPSAAPKNIAKSNATRLANLELLPFANEESAPMPVIVNVRTVVVRSELPNSGIPRAHGKRRQSDQSKRLKRMIQQIASVSDAAKRRHKQKDHLQHERLRRESNL